MALTRRKPRPLARDSQTFRDDRLFIIACDDTYAPKQYFEFFKIHRVHVHVVHTDDGESSAERVLDRLLEYEHREFDERWLVLDTDHYVQGPHLASFTRALARARQTGINVALSKHCFELWLLLHHLPESQIQPFADCAAITAKLREVLGNYNKTRLDREAFPLASVQQACQRAQQLDETVGGGEIPNALTSRVYRIWHSICDRALATQLPEELRPIKQRLAQK